jgi:toxin ParE1/3/4
MSLPTILRPEAEVDIQTNCDELERVQPGLGRRFVAGVREILERIETMPEIYGAIWKDVHAARLKKFQYVVYHVVFEDRVEVLAVLHGARDAPTWKSRA